MSEQIQLGFIPLLDSAPLIVAQNLGLFQEYHLDVSLNRENSWASLIEKITLGVYQGGHMLTPAIVAEALHQKTPRMISPINMGLNGNAITLSHRLTNANVTLAEFAQKMKKQQQKLTFAVVYPFSMHSFQLRMWLEQQGVDPVTDVHIRVVPPQSMWQALSNEEIDGFCAGEPWNTHAQQLGGCSIVASGYEIWPDAPEKSLGLNARWSEANPEQVTGLTKAIYLACEWLDSNIDNPKLVQWLRDSDALPLPEDSIRDALLSPVGHKKYFCQQATEPSEDKIRSIALHIQRWHPEWVRQDITHALKVFDVEGYAKTVATLGR